MEDTRNLIDEFKGKSNEQIFAELEKNRTSLEIAIENVEHDFNIGSIVRTANSLSARKNITAAVLCVPISISKLFIIPLSKNS